MLGTERTKMQDIFITGRIQSIEVLAFVNQG